jgi:hypothetical protein
MIHHIWLAPLGAVGAGTLGPLYHAGVEHEVVQPGPAQLVEGLLRKGLDRLEVRELEGQHCEAVGLGVELELVVGLLGSLRVPRAEDESVRLGLGQQLFYELETLCFCLSASTHGAAVYICTAWAPKLLLTDQG